MRLLGLLGSFLAGTLAVAQASPLRVGTITIRALDIYSDSEAKRGRLYSLADALHVETRPSVIRKFLLFHEGDVYSPERLAETERNLRTLPFLKSARVTASEPHEGVVDILVITQDTWSIAPETQAGSKGGATTYGVTISEDNLLGLGKEVAIRWNKTVDRRRAGIDYQDPALNADRWTAHLTYALNSDGHDQLVQIRRPFYSFATPWATDFTLRNLVQDDRVYSRGERSGLFREHDRDVLATFGMAVDPNDVRANRFVGGLHFTRQTFDQPTTSILPDDRDYRYAFVRFEHVDNDFITLNFINKDLRFEDFNLGRQMSLGAGISPRILGAPVNSARTRATVTDGTRLGPASFLIPSIAVESRFDGGVENLIAATSVLYVHRYDTAHPSVTVGRLVFNSGWRLDRDVQFFADADSGLRAYDLHDMDGSRALVMNLEHRIYLGREVAQLASPGVVAFVDAGNATYRGLGSLMSLRADVGVGIRVGLPRTPKNLLRVDFAYPLRHGNIPRHGIVISFSSGQAF